jgi:hypothetical protein
VIALKRSGKSLTAPMDLAAEPSNGTAGLQSFR